MKRPGRQSNAGFTMIELIIGMTLALAITTGVLSTYLFLGRNLSRLVNQQKLEAEGRQALLYFAQDVRAAASVGSAADTAITLALPSGTGTTNVVYTYSSGAGTLTRTVGAGTAVTLLTNLQTFEFDYYDSDDDALSASNFPTKLSSIKKVAMKFTSQTGTSTNGTRTPIHYGVSPRLLLRNKELLGY